MMHRYSFTVEGQSCNFMKKLCLQLALFPLVFFCPNDRAQAQQKKPVAEYTVTQWASDPAIARGVGISVSDRGAAYVTTIIKLFLKTLIPVTVSPTSTKPAEVPSKS